MLIIYAHPNKDGHCGEILKQITKELKGNKSKYTILDLYNMKYDPILAQKEHYTSGHKTVSKDTLKMQKYFKENDRFLFIYPTWWQNVPAILKGFLDRVFISGFAFKFVGRFPKKLLNGKAAVISTTGGPRLYTKIFACDRAIKVVTKDTLNFCGIKSKPFYLGNANRFTESKKQPISRIVKKALNYLR